MTGIEDKALATEIAKASYLFQFKKKLPLSYDALDRRAKDDVQRLRDVMMAHAYYGADIRYKITKHTALAESETRLRKEEHHDYDVVLDIRTGPVFEMQDFKVKWENKSGSTITAPKGIKLDGPLQGVVGKQATPAVILDVERQVLDKLKANGYPLPGVASRDVTIDHATQKARAVLRVVPGRAATFADVRTAGHDSVNEDFVRRRIDFKEAEVFNIKKIITTRQQMLKTGLFSSVDVVLAAKEGSDKVPVTINFTERKPRTIGAGVAYSTSQSVSSKVFWEHRNLFGGGEKLRLEADAGVMRYGAGVRYTKPDFTGTIDRSLQSGLGFNQENLDSYDKTSYSAFTRLDQTFSDTLSGKLGLTAEFSQIDENNQPEKDFWLLSMPATLAYDSSNDTLDPTKGARVSLDVTPYLSVQEAKESFTVTTLSASHYWPLAAEDKIVFANRAKLGAIFGQGTSDIPADKRFYSGGGGSVRGYGYQLVSPLDANDDPTGGRYQIEIGSEMRFRVTDTVGLVTFIEGGRVTEDISASGNEKFLFAAGVGARYYTAVGPLRVDIGVPINGRDKDDIFQIYLSLGQAF
jgi:translocation and assembly module TamA